MLKSKVIELYVHYLTRNDTIRNVEMIELEN